MHQKITLLIILFAISKGISQSTVKMKSVQNKISLETEFLIPLEDKLIYEKYMYFKGVHFLSISDTLSQLNDSIFKKNTIEINSKQFNKSLKFCDSTINYIRNSSLYHTYLSKINKISNDSIGRNNKEFSDFKRENFITEKIVRQTCSNEFPMILQVFSDKCLRKIDEISVQKKMQTEWVKNNPDKIDLLYVQSFVKNVSDCKADQETFIELIIANPRNVILTIEGIDYLSIAFDLNDLEDLRDSIRVQLALDVLKNRNLYGKMNRKVIRILKKTSREIKKNELEKLDKN